MGISKSKYRNQRLADEGFILKKKVSNWMQNPRWLEDHRSLSFPMKLHWILVDSWIYKFTTMWFIWICLYVYESLPISHIWATTTQIIVLVEKTVPLINRDDSSGCWCPTISAQSNKKGVRLPKFKFNRLIDLFNSQIAVWDAGPAVDPWRIVYWPQTE